jgi:antitoxin component YwqK of YwqJK toxin-antitoxin module
LDTYGDYKNGLKSGKWVENAHSDAGKNEGEYIKGKKNGFWKLGATNLFGKCQGSFINDKKDGNWDYWKHDGSKWKSEKWENGVLIKS